MKTESMIFLIGCFLIASGVLLVTNFTPEPDTTLSDINETLNTLHAEILDLQAMQWEVNVLLTGLHEIAPPPDTIYITLPNPQPWPRHNAPYHGITVPIEGYSLIQEPRS